MNKTCPKNFKKLASAPDLYGMNKQMLLYFGGEQKDLIKCKDGYEVHSPIKGKLNYLVLETTRGFYFGYYE